MSLAKDANYNPNRNQYLYWRTAEGYIIAQDTICQYEYIEASACPHCQQSQFHVVAQLNRAGQGLIELVSLCKHCRQRTSFIFDISNIVYQQWLAAQLGDLYITQYDGEPRTPVYPAD